MTRMTKREKVQLMEHLDQRQKEADTCIHIINGDRQEEKKHL